MTNDLKWMLSSDQHFPYHEPRYIDLWFKVLKWFKPQVIDYLGDISDQDCYSRFSDGRTDEFLNQIAKNASEPALPFILAQEAPAREFYTQTRRMFPNAEIFAALGNHDIRVFEYVDKKLPGYNDEVNPDSLWDFKNLGIDWIHYGEMPKQRYGDIHVHHGLSISKNAGESVKKDVEDFGVSIVRGHSHRAGSFFRTYDLKQETLRGFEIGHMVDINSKGMSYTALKNWQPGFAIAHIERTRSTMDGWYPHIQFIHISPDYSCVVDGKLFKA